MNFKVLVALFCGIPALAKASPAPSPAATPEPRTALLLGGAVRGEFGIAACANPVTHEWLAPEACVLPQQVMLHNAGKWPIAGRLVKVNFPEAADYDYDLRAELPRGSHKKVSGVVIVGAVRANWKESLHRNSVVLWNSSKLQLVHSSEELTTSIAQLQQILTLAKLRQPDSVALSLHGWKTADFSSDRGYVKLGDLLFELKKGNSVRLITFPAIHSTRDSKIAPCAEQSIKAAGDGSGAWSVIAVTDLNDDAVEELVLENAESKQVMILAQEQLIGRLWGESSCSRG